MVTGSPRTMRENTSMSTLAPETVATAVLDGFTFPEFSAAYSSGAGTFRYDLLGPKQTPHGRIDFGFRNEDRCVEVSSAEVEGEFVLHSNSAPERVGR